MKTINKYINERLHITSKIQYSCQPKTKNELRSIIIERIKEDGQECNLNDIDVSNITDMSCLFDAFDNKIFNDFNGDISQWNVSNVKNMNHMFYRCEQFNCDLSKWNVSNVENMGNMFCKCKKFNCDLSQLYVSKVTHMEYMFYECEKFDCDLSGWDVSNVKYMQYMFKKCKSFRQNLDEWNVSNVTDMNDSFHECPTKPKWYNGI